MSRRIFAPPAASALARLAALTLLSGCATLEQQGVRPPPPSPPIAAPKAIVDTPQQAERKKLIALYGGEYQWPKAQTYLNQVLIRLAKASDTPTQPYRVTILNSAVVNAFALPSGDLFVTRGLLALANDTSEVAAVMAHEIAHVTARHALLRAEKEKTEAVIAQAARVIESRQKGDEVQATAARTIASYSRLQEFEADRIGITVIARAGYDPFGASRFLSSLARSSQMRAELIGQKDSGAPDILATHPSTPERIAASLQVARQFGAPGIGGVARQPYLNAIDGMIFGDDPVDGAIRGRKFIHPRLGFSFEAPEGYMLENSAQAVLGVADGGAEALRFDSVRAPPGKTLKDYLTSGWIDGLVASSIHESDVNGLPAVFADARAGEWNFRVAVIAFNGDLYRLIFAIKAMTPEASRRFDEAIASFRPMTEEEKRLAQPLRLRLAMAGPGDTAATLAAKMVLTDRPIEQFELLNGLDSDQVKPGEDYKIVAY
ncbi:M48 family metalloprotease [Rhodoblastus acidophilus]|uniref:M48 family metalloprotease n=2 Tax=Candidatus Rhodoblastus alkanivorans TaxID=2954117 RepID=A0ABS9Z397_9HYPH|nr:M48 family metalloprotease [Candidatus Rhodoblastus alkanivorans]MCI4678013.1 M48 family metalloprotease [Candidatus Rhodoblastus alkanivorans]MCI4681647.1 M48 family metalloprotease [Candidatus Rhodoblastus alkanivorans]MDI4642694.1 M48 family metalloprotease [Rhodoblastus acidophilus]